MHLVVAAVVVHLSSRGGAAEHGRQRSERGVSRGIAPWRFATLSLVAVLYDNPAGRLLHVFGALKGMPTNTALIDAVTATLHVERHDREALYAAYAGLARLPRLAEAAISELENVNLTLNLRWLSPIQNAISALHRLDNTLDAVTSHYSEADLVSLETCADTLERQRPGREHLDQDSLAEARDLVDKLLKTLHAAKDLDQDTQHLLIRHATAMQVALNLADVVGPEGIRDAAAGALGAAVMVAVQHPHDRQKRPVRAFFEVVQNVANTVTIAAGAAQLTPVVQRLLELAAQ